MSTYIYTAKSLGGEIKSGTLEAGNEHELAKILHQEGFVLTSASIQEKNKRQISFSIPFLFGGVSLSEKMMFVRNLRIMVSAGVSLPKALGILAAQAKSRKLRAALNDVAENIIKGKNFSDALAVHADVFPEIFASMVKVGEESGTLEEALKTLTLQTEREYELKSKIKGAMMYPAVIITAMVGVGIMMLAIVVPQLAVTFDELGVDLPLTTRIVIAAGNFIAKRWYLLPVLIPAAVLIFRFALGTKVGKKIKDRVLLETPIISPLVKQADSAYITRTLSSLISAGVSLVRALEIISNNIGNLYFKEALTRGMERTKKGEKLSEALGDYTNLFPLTVIQMLQVGEETGKTVEILQKLADFYEEEVASATKNLSVVIEPILMLLIGGAVGFFAVSMIQPMYSMLGEL